MARTLLTAPTDFFFNSSGGSLGNDGLSLGNPLPTAQDVVNLLYTLDLGGQQVQVHDVAGNVDPIGIHMAGPLVGQRGETGLVFLFNGIIRPSNSVAGIEMSSGASCSVQGVTIDGITQALAGHPQDCIMLGQGARLALWGTNTVLQNNYSHNGITLQNSDLDISPQSWGSQIQNGGHLHFGGQYQCGIQTDQCANIEANCNGQHNLIAFWADASSVRSKPYWAVDFIDVASGVTVLSGVDFHGTADGYRYRIRKGGTLDLNLVQDPNQQHAIFGSADTAWPVQGYLI